MTSTKIFFDTEFTGLHQNTKLISIGLIAEDGSTYYAESNEFKDGFVSVDDIKWANENLLPCLKFYGKNTRAHNNYTLAPYPGGVSEIYGDEGCIKDSLTGWLSRYDKVELWSDCLAYDFVLFNQLWGHAFKIPKNVYYIPFDLATLFKIRGIDPDINREEFAGMTEGAEKHNALWDARVIRECYEKLMGRGSDKDDRSNNSIQA